VYQAFLFFSPSLRREKKESLIAGYGALRGEAAPADRHGQEKIVIYQAKKFWQRRNSHVTIHPSAPQGYQFEVAHT